MIINFIIISKQKVRLLQVSVQVPRPVSELNEGNALDDSEAECNDQKI